MTDISNPKELTDASRRSLADFILSVADTKRWLGIRYAEWSDGGPTLEASVAASAMAQDELGHSRALLPLLSDFPEIDPGIPAEAPRDRYRSMGFLDRPFTSWSTFVAANILIGGALTVALEAARASRFVPLRTRAVKILEEERFHWLHGEGWFNRLAADGASGSRLADAAQTILPEALCWFGPSQDDLLVREAILDSRPDELRVRLLNRVGPLLAKSAAAHLVRFQDGGWAYSGGLPWARFDPVARRLNERS